MDLRYKITPVQRRNIARLITVENRSVRSVALQYGISRMHVTRIAGTAKERTKTDWRKYYDREKHSLKMRAYRLRRSFERQLTDVKIPKGW